MASPFGPAPAQAEPVTPAPWAWSWWGALLLVVATLVAQIIAAVIASIPLLTLEVLGHADLTNRWMTPAISFTTTGVVLLLLLAVRRWSGAKPLWDRRDLQDWKNWALGIAGLLVCAGANILRIWLEREPSAPELNQQILALVETSPSTPWAPLAMLGVAVVILAPLTEEWLFRGILLPALQRATGARREWLGAGVGVLVSSIIFGLLHWPIWWVPAVYGAVLGLLSLRQRSLAWPLLIHGVINLTVFSLVVTAA